jgi:hypothetical protein
MVRTSQGTFWSKVSKAPWIMGCWDWMGAKDSKGYGRIWFGPAKKTLSAHRVSYILSGRRISEGHLVCHICDNPSCVRPDHLFTGTQKDNMQDAAAKGRLGKNRTTGTMGFLSYEPEDEDDE